MKLNLGAGPSPLAGFTNVDLCYEGGTAASDPQPDGISRVSGEVYPLPEILTGKAECLRASHCLEHFPHGEVMDVLADWVRCLAPGGWLRIAVPDLPKVIAAYEAGHPLAQGYLYGGQTDERDFHKCGFDEETLRAAFEHLGLTDIRHWNDGARDCSSLPISLNLEGRKPGGEPLAAESEHYPWLAYPGEGVRSVCGCGWRGPLRSGQDGEDLAHADGQDHLAATVEEAPEPQAVTVDLSSVQAVMTAPRFGSIDADQAILKAFNTLDIGLLRSGGVFWDQGITRVIEQAIAAGKQWIITVDYDSLFTGEDVARLLAVIQHTPEIDALAAFQQRRELDSPLFHLGRGEGEQELDLNEVLARETLPVVTAHFGLTVFRASAFAKLERPWFLAVPGPDGGWGEGRMDSDIAFWHRWKDAGNSLHIALRVPIGHVEVVTSWPDRRMQRQYQPISEWHAGGKPAWAWS